VQWLFGKLAQLSPKQVATPLTGQPSGSAVNDDRTRQHGMSSQKASSSKTVPSISGAQSNLREEAGGQTAAPGAASGSSRPRTPAVHSNLQREARGLYLPPRSGAGPPLAPDNPEWRRSFAYTPSGQAAPDAPIVPCAGWASAGAGERGALLEAAFGRLRASGYVVLEELLPAEQVLAAGEEFRRYKSSHPEGVTFSRMRASRDMTVPPFEGIWTEDWLVRHPLVLSLIARYLRNSTHLSHEKEAEMSFAHWVAGGSNIDDFLTGPSSAGFPVLDLLVVVDTPAGAEAQTRHRDTILPGPCASLGMHIPLTPLQTDPLNGPIGFVPGTHVLGGDASCEVVGAVPPGSVVLYDSFLEHRGLENVSSAPRSALFAWFRVPGVYSGHTQENFGPDGLWLTDAFRRHIGERLDEAEARERAAHPGAAPPEGDEAWGFSRGSPLVTWGEERVCFRCDCTRSSGAAPPRPAGDGSRGEWYCAACWEDCQRRGTSSPSPALANVMPPEEFEGRFPEARLEELMAQGLNIKAGRGRHKLTQLRERGLFLPVDPSSSWLAGISNDPQPSGWRDALRKALGEIPRMDGF